MCHKEVEIGSLAPRQKYLPICMEIYIFTYYACTYLMFIRVLKSESWCPKLVSSCTYWKHIIYNYIYNWHTNKEMTIDAHVSIYSTYKISSPLCVLIVSHTVQTCI